jgi:hypothetical protein
MIHIEGMSEERQRLANEGMRTKRARRVASKYRRMTVAERRAWIAEALRPVLQPMCWCGRKQGHNGLHRGELPARWRRA